MPFSIVCSCGARLEIDDKFAGKVVNCPDCHKELTTEAPPPVSRKTSGYALASLMLALIGAFTLIGPPLAVLLGWLSLRQQARHPEIGGRNYARAGMLLGGIFTVLGLGAFVAPGVPGVDGLFREIEWARQLDYPGDLQFSKESGEFSLSRVHPSWGIYRHRARNETQPRIDEFDDLILVKPRDDAQVTLFSAENFDRGEPERDVEEALRRFRRSELLSLLGPGAAQKSTLPDEAIRDKKALLEPRGAQELLIDFKLAGHARTFLVRVIKGDGAKIRVLAAGSRQRRFAGMEAELRKILDSYKSER